MLNILVSETHIIECIGVVESDRVKGSEGDGMEDVGTDVVEYLGIEFDGT